MSDEWLKSEAKLQVVSKGVTIHESRIDPALGRDATVVVIPAADFHDTRPADVRAAANAPWELPDFPQVHSRLEQRSRELRELFDRVCGLRIDRVGGTSSEWRQIAEARQVALEGALQRIAALEASQDGEASGQIEHLDRENARLRRELAALRIERDNSRADAQRYASNADYWRERVEQSPTRSSVIKVEPFADAVEPRDESWPPPSHKPRMLP